MSKFLFALLGLVAMLNPARLLASVEQERRSFVLVDLEQLERETGLTEQELLQRGLLRDKSNLELSQKLIEQMIRSDDGSGTNSRG